MVEETIDYDFLKKFTESCTSRPNGGVGTNCKIIVIAPLKTKKGTKNNPSPFYDREIFDDDENKRYIISTVKSYEFIYGDKYEDHVEEGHVFESDTTADGVKRKEKPDASIPMLSLNKTGKYCIDVVAPRKFGKTNYYVYNYRNGYEPADDKLVEEAMTWMPATSNNSQSAIFKQYSIENVLALINCETHEIFANPNVSRKIIAGVINISE